MIQFRGCRHQPRGQLPIFSSRYTHPALIINPTHQIDGAKFTQLLNTLPDDPTIDDYKTFVAHLKEIAPAFKALKTELPLPVSFYYPSFEDALTASRRRLRVRKRIWLRPPPNWVWSGRRPASIGSLLRSLLGFLKFTRPSVRVLDSLILPLLAFGGPSPPITRDVMIPVLKPRTL